MSKQFDATMKYLVELQPAAWLEYVGVSSGDAEVLEENWELLNTDLSTITAVADTVIRIKGPRPSLTHIEFQAGASINMDRRTLRYNALLDYKYELPVESVVILLCKEADHPAITRQIIRHKSNGEPYLEFSYLIVRVWKEPVEKILTGPIGALPLATLANVLPSDLPEIIRRIEQRFKAESKNFDTEEFWTSVYILMGLRYEPEVSAKLLQGVRGMEQSSTYQVILNKGKAIGEAIGEAMGEAIGEVHGIRESILRIGRKRFGEPTQNVLDTLNSISSRVRLEELTDRLLEVETWNEFFRQN